MRQPQDLIQQYKLQPHPEGGWYTETYKSNEQIPASGLPARFQGNRFFSSAIYFLLEKGDFSAFHQIKSDECWHFYAGGSLLIYILYPHGSLEVVSLGPNAANGDCFQYVVPANTWFASMPADNSVFSFVGCTVAPAFDFADFELASRQSLIEAYPQHSDLITRLTR